MSEISDAFGIGEALALKLFKDVYAFPMRLYFGDVKMTAQAWRESYDEMMSKPTDMSKEDWHAECQKK